MINLFLIGIGTGNPKHLTVEGRLAIAEADLFLIPHKGKDKSDLADLRTQIIADIRSDANIVSFDMPVRDAARPYIDRVYAWHKAISNIWSEAIANHPNAIRIALLVWGDPSLYDSSIRIAALLNPVPKLTVIPGITSIQALTAAHGISLNTLNAPVTISTGRQLRDHGWPLNTETLVVMLDGTCAFHELDGADYDIWWGAYLGMKEQVLEAGKLSETTSRIIERRGVSKSSHGWIMDIYLLRKRSI
jgi:precorrin-6A synthase